MRTRLGALSAVLAACGVLSCEPLVPKEAEPNDLSLGPAPVLGMADDGSAIIYFARNVNLALLAADGRKGRRALIEALRQDAERAQGPVLELLREHGVEARAQLWMINALAARVPLALLEEIARMPEVDHIGADLSLERLEPQETDAPKAGEPATSAAWNLSAIRAPELWAAGMRGAGAVVAVLDTGTDLAHPALAGSWRRAAGWYDPYHQHTLPFDEHGHGTQVLGLVVAGQAGGASIGVAPGARWIAAKIFDDEGVASLSAIHLALQWVLDPDGDPSSDDTPDVVSAAWGYDQRRDSCDLEFQPDIAALRAAQVANVFSAGNTGPQAGSSISPANNPSAFAVGAVDQERRVISASGRGPNACTGSIFPELVAPGANVRTTDRTLRGRFPDSYVTVSGTSFSAPHVAGAIALLRAAYPSSTVAQLEHALTKTAQHLTPARADHQSGFGLPDLVKAEDLLARLVTTPRCTDGDRDGYFVEPSCGSALDCNDDDPAISPGACDQAQDGIDQDCDGSERLRGQPCPR